MNAWVSQIIHGVCMYNNGWMNTWLSQQMNIGVNEYIKEKGWKTPVK